MIIAMEPGKLIVDKVMQEAQNKLSESMFGMMLGGSFLEKIAGQVQDGIDTYIQENARRICWKSSCERIERTAGKANAGSDSLS